MYSCMRTPRSSFMISTHLRSCPSVALLIPDRKPQPRDQELIHLFRQSKLADERNMKYVRNTCNPWKSEIFTCLLILSWDLLLIVTNEIMKYFNFIMNSCDDRRHTTSYCTEKSYSIQNVNSTHSVISPLTQIAEQRDHIANFDLLHSEM